MLDADVLGAAFDAAQNTYGKDRFTEAEVLEMATRAVTPGLRKTWCKVFGLSKEQTARVLAQPYDLSKLGKASRMTPEQVEEQRKKSGRTGFEVTGLTEEERHDVVQGLLDLWYSEEPKRRGRRPLWIGNKQEIPSDLDAFGRSLHQWIDAATPLQPANDSSRQRVARALAHWSTVVHTVYSNDRLNGTVPGLRGCSLEWLASPIQDKENGRVWLTLRLERVLSGYYKLDDHDAESMARAKVAPLRDPVPA